MVDEDGGAPAASQHCSRLGHCSTVWALLTTPRNSVHHSKGRHQCHRVLCLSARNFERFSLPSHDDSSRQRSNAHEPETTPLTGTSPRLLAHRHRCTGRPYRADQSHAGSRILDRHRWIDQTSRSVSRTVTGTPEWASSTEDDPRGFSVWLLPNSGGVLSAQNGGSARRTLYDGVLSGDRDPSRN